MAADIEKIKQIDDASDAESPPRRLLKQREIQLLLLLVVFTFLVRVGGAPSFMGSTHFPIFLSQVAPDMLVVIPMAMLLIGGMFDLSVTGVANLSVVLIGWTFSRFVGQMDDTLLIILVVAIGLLAGLTVGLVNGFAVTRLRMNPLMTTLATWWMAQGAATGFAGGESRHNFVGSFRAIARHQPLQGLGELFPVLQEMRISTLPMPVFYALIVIFLGWLILTRTRFGWHIFATGSDRQGAALNGVKVKRVTLIGFIATGMAAAMCGAVWASRLTSAPPNTLGGLELRVIAAAVIGGAALTGGEGSVLGAVLGLFFMHMIRSATIQLGLPVYWEYFVLGVVLFTAVAFDAFAKRQAETDR
jgi:ribose transport system permease protein